MQSVGQALSPAFVTSLFAFSIQSHILGGNLVYIAMLLISAIGVIQSFKVIDSSEKLSIDLPKSDAGAEREADRGV